MKPSTLTQPLAFPALKWFTGKARANAETALKDLAAAVARGHWASGESRRIRAALNKQAVAKTFALAQERRDPFRGLDETEFEGCLADVCDNRKRPYESTVKGWPLVHAMMFGAVSHAPDCLKLVAQLKPLCRNAAEVEALRLAKEWAEHFAPVAEQLEALDATRPPPVIVMGSISRTVLNTVGTSMGVNLTTIRLPEIVYVRCSGRNKEGKRVYWSEPRIVWPEGTRHGCSRFALSITGQQCHACGHRIRNPFNWVPLVADTDDGPVSLWVGSDCARNLFAVDVTSNQTDFRAGDPVQTKGAA